MSCWKESEWFSYLHEMIYNFPRKINNLCRWLIFDVRTMTTFNIVWAYVDVTESSYWGNVYIYMCIQFNILSVKYPYIFCINMNSHMLMNNESGFIYWPCSLTVYDQCACKMKQMHCGLIFCSSEMCRMELTLCMGKAASISSHSFHIFYLNVTR